MRLGALISGGLAPLVDLVYPPRCPVCGGAIGRHGGLCLECWSQLVFPGVPACSQCSRPLSDNAQDGSICAPCLADPPEHAGIFAATLYNEPSRKLVLSFKHGGKVGLAPLLAKLIASRIPDVDDELPLIVPVPLHRWRLWRRGYNQAALLGEELQKLGKGELCVDALARCKATPSLGGLGKKTRERTLKGAIAAAPGRKARVMNRSVILVDDVLTSGSTANACVRALNRAGAKKVSIACFARVLDEALHTSGSSDLAPQSETPEV